MKICNLKIPEARILLYFTKVTFGAKWVLLSIVS